MPKNLVGPPSVWATGQCTPQRQVSDRHVSMSRSDIALTPVIAQWIIQTYTEPGDLVCDPNPGPGLALVESIRADRHVVALSPHPRWQSALEANLDLARLAGSTGEATLLDGIDDPRAASLPGAVDLVLTGLRPTPASDPSRLLVNLYEDLGAVADWVWPGGHVIITCRPWRRRRHLVDLPGQIHDAASAVGLKSADHCVALASPIHDYQVRARQARNRITDPRTHDIHGIPTAHPTHLDVLVFQAPAAGHAAQGGGH